MKFLVIDQDAEGLDLLARTLARKFPYAEIVQCSEVGNCIEIVGSQKLDVIVVHRAIGTSGMETIRQLRAASASVPIVMVSGTDRSQEAVEAGANSFLLYDSWLMLGGVVADVIRYDSAEPWPKS